MQIVTDAGTLEGLLEGHIGARTLTKVPAINPKLCIPIEIENGKFLYFVYGKFSPKAEDLEKKGVIAVAYDENYIGVPLSRFKGKFQKKILKQVFDSEAYAQLAVNYMRYHSKD